MTGGYGRGRRHRHWYHATGMPGYGRGRRRFCPYPPDVLYPGAVPDPWAMGPGAPYELSAEDEARMLEEEHILSEELEDIRKRLEALQEETKKEVK
jgi:hypothetical protein